jgi:U3 small nucleolar ribonucleoprotein protein IMP4
MIYQREREIQERQTFHRKQQLKDALASGKNLPTELRRDAVKLGKDLHFDDAQVGEFNHFSPSFCSGTLTVILFFALFIGLPNV